MIEELAAEVLKLREEAQAEGDVIAAASFLEVLELINEKWGREIAKV